MRSGILDQNRNLGWGPYHGPGDRDLTRGLEIGTLPGAWRWGPYQGPGDRDLTRGLEMGTLPGAWR
jgi:hypothetical protein